MQTSLGRLALSLTLLCSAACTRTIEVKYLGGFPYNPEMKAASKVLVAVLPFTDTRSWVDKGDEQSRSFVGKQGAWRFGLGYGGKEYIPVSTLVQRIFVDEFTAVGYEAFAAETPPAGAYSLSGKIMTFEFENETGVFTVTSRRTVTLALTLTDKDGRKVADELLFDESDREGEGMGVMHGTNADKLLNRVFKRVVGAVLTKLQPRFVAAGAVGVRVTINGALVRGERLETFAVACAASP